jgi:glucosamine-6-phosphate deaminase
MASGEAKAEAIRATVEGPIASTVPGSMLQRHRNVHVLIDHDASSKLRRMAS